MGGRGLHLVHYHCLYDAPTHLVHTCRVRKLDELEERMSLALSRIEQQQVAMARWQPPTLHATSSGIAQSSQPLGPVTWAGAGAGAGVGVGVGSAGDMLLGAGSAWNMAPGAGLGATGLMSSAGLGGGSAGDGGSSAIAAGLFGALAAQGLTLGARPLVQVQQQGTQAGVGMHASQGTQAGAGMHGGLGGASTTSIGVGGEASGLLSRAVSGVGQGFGAGMGAGLDGRMLGGMAAGSAASELGLAELQQLLLVLQRMEDKEEAMR